MLSPSSITWRQISHPSSPFTLLGVTGTHWAQAMRASNNKPTLGFANPFFYGLLSTNPEAFNDITTGKNDGGHSTGFAAAKGWDPCTGIGTLKYDVLKKLV